MIATFAVLAYVLIQNENDAKNDPAVKAAKRAEKALKGHSLVEPAALTAALGLARSYSHGEGGVLNLDVRKDRADLEVRDVPGKEYTVDVGASRGVQTNDFGTTREAGVPWEKIDAQAPSRMLAEAQRRFGADPKQFDYVVYQVDSGRVKSLVMYVKTAGPSDQYSASRHG